MRIRYLIRNGKKVFFNQYGNPQPYPSPLCTKLDTYKLYQDNIKEVKKGSEFLKAAKWYKSRDLYYFTSKN